MGAALHADAAISRSDPDGEEDSLGPRDEYADRSWRVRSYFHLPGLPLHGAQVMHEIYMREALQLARVAGEAGEVPVGAIVIVGDQVIGRGRNSPVSLIDPTAHAEMLALRDAALAVSNYRLEFATLYSTLEPCVMCAGALVAARIKTLVFGARDLRFGGVRSKFR